MTSNLFTYFNLIFLILAVLLCLTALADALDRPGRLLLFGGCALLLTVFLLLRRDGAPAEA